ncbi:MAG: hypothetical protein ACTSRC_18765 [Candidatus Helarchaeota archaeon]
MQKVEGAQNGPIEYNLEYLAFEFTRHLSFKDICPPRKVHPLLVDDEIAIDTGYARDVLRDIEALCGCVAEMVAKCKIDDVQVECKDFFMYFVTRFQTLARDFTELIHASGESLLTEAQIRAFLSRLQRTYIKVLAIYEVFEGSEYPEYEYIEKYLKEHRDKVLANINFENERFEKANQLDIEVEDQFQTQVSNFLNMINLNMIRTLFSYMTIYLALKLPHATRRYITDTIARALFLIYEVQERIDISQETIYMKPDALLHNLYQLFTELKIFLNFTMAYTKKVKFKEAIEAESYSIKLFGQRKHERGEVELFSSRKCIVCQTLFTSPLWEFIQTYCHHHGYKITIHDIYLPTDEAWCKGIYEITKVPTLRFQERICWINPEPERERESDPYQTMKTRLLNFFESLGLYKEGDTLEGVHDLPYPGYKEV